MQSFNTILHSTSYRGPMANMRISDIVKNYRDQKTSGDFAEWAEKLELVADIQQCSDKLASLLPLLLEGPAFAVFKQLPDDVKKEYQRSKAELLSAFGANCFDAYDRFRERVLQDDETVDVYLSDLKRLISLVGVNVTAAQPLIKCAFIAGLPVDVAKQLKSAAEVEKMGIDALVSRTRLVLSTTRDFYGGRAVAAGRRRDQQCFACGERGHFARNCSRRPDYLSKEDDRRRGTGPMICFSCGKPGHIARFCRRIDHKGEERENFNGEPSSAPDAFSVPRR